MSDKDKYYTIKTGKNTYKFINKQDVRDGALFGLLVITFALSGFLN